MIKNRHSISRRFQYIVLALASAGTLLAMPVSAADKTPVPAVKPEADSGGIFGAASSLLGLSDAKSPRGKKLTELEKLQIKSAKQKSNNLPISKSDADLYKIAFEAQERGDIKQSDEALKKIGDLRLLGHVLYQRYMHPDAYRSSFGELKTWLDFYADHPGADKLYRLAQSRAPSGYKGTLAKPEKAKIIAQMHEPTMHIAKEYVPAGKKSGAGSSIMKKVSKYVDDGRMDDALAYMKDPSVAANLDNAQYDIARADIAAGMLYSGDTDSAYALAAKSFARSGKFAPKAGWVAGLVSWKNGRYQDAARFFEVTAHSPYASGWTQASAAYWAARSHMRVGNVKPVSAWLQRGMTYPRTFYGLVSNRALGRDFDFNWHIPTFTRESRDILSQIPAGNRAIALVEAGQLDLAQSELLRVNPANPEERDALLAYAGYVNLPGLGMRMASALSGSDQTYDAALYPDSPWAPQNGFKLDTALVNAIMRQESKFDPEAESPSGARGLMQLLPSTAKLMAGKGELALEDPEFNLELGQRYLQRLMKDSAVQDNLFMLLIAYNAGPGNLAKWKKRWPDVEDPLLFIELIPSGETRAYVEHVLANYWIYRLKEDKPVPSLDSIVSGKEARYADSKL